MKEPSQYLTAHKVCNRRASAGRDVCDHRRITEEPAQQVKRRQGGRQTPQDIKGGLDRRLREQCHEDRMRERGVVRDQGREVVRGEDRRRGELWYQRAEDLGADDAVSSSEPGRRGT